MLKGYPESLYRAPVLSFKISGPSAHNFKASYLPNTAVAWPFRILCQDKEETDACSFYMTWPETAIFFVICGPEQGKRKNRSGGRECGLGVEEKERGIQKGALKRGPFLPAVNLVGHEMIYSHQRGQTKAVRWRTERYNRGHPAEEGEGCVTVGQHSFTIPEETCRCSGSVSQSYRLMVQKMWIFKWLHWCLSNLSNFIQGHSCFCFFFVFLL